MKKLRKPTVSRKSGVLLLKKYLDHISPGIRSGTYTIMKNTMISPIRYGTTDLEIRSIGSPVIPEATNRLMATGGVIIPIAMPTTNRIPK